MAGSLPQAYLLQSSSEGWPHCLDWLPLAPLSSALVGCLSAPGL